MAKSKREKLAEGIMDKLIQSFYTKKHDYIIKKMGGIDPDLKKQAEKVKKAQDELKASLMNLKNHEDELVRKYNIPRDSDGRPDPDKMVAAWRDKIAKWNK
tara:strand:- start:395 stop:697 length:303 start_codon:yes stop_codon:yes gene_type:complete